MSEQEFELYLKLLSKLLKLNPNQRAEISDEMRDHLEARFNDLVKNGCERSEAIELALDEFGDANVLAGEFSKLATRQRRRKIMRLTFGTIVSSACLIFIIQAMWPESHLSKQNQFVTNLSHAEDKQDQPDKEKNKAKPDKAVEVKSQPKEKTWIFTSNTVREKMISLELDSPITLDFLDSSLVEVVEYLSDKISVSIMIRYDHLEEEGSVDPEEGRISLNVTDISLRSALNLILVPLNLTYRIQNEVLIIDTTTATAESGQITRVYNCRDLLSVPSVEVKDDGTWFDPKKSVSQLDDGTFSVQDSIISQLGPTLSSQFGSGAGSGRKKKTEAPKSYSPAQIREKILIDVIRNSTGQEESWSGNEEEGGATIVAYHGMLIVTAPENLHRNVVQLLEMLREAFRGDNLLNEDLAKRNKGYQLHEVPVRGRTTPLTPAEDDDADSDFFDNSDKKKPAKKIITPKADF
jgi:hypothetical protein